jgi:hypothetical protein
MVRTGQNFDLPQGDDITLDFDVDPATVDEDDQDLDGARIEWGLYPYSGYSPDAANPVVTKNTDDDPADFDITDSAGMKFSVKVNRADSLNVPPGIYYHQAKIIAASGKYYTVTKGSGIVEVST